MNVFLTGGSRGIGAAIAELLRGNGMMVIAPDRTALDLRGNCQWPTEVSFDGLIHCAGVNSPSEHWEEKVFVDTMNINASSFAKLCLGLRFRSGANLLAIGSLYANASHPGRLAYSMSKHALLAAVRTMALQLAPEAKVNMISPGFVQTAMTRRNVTETRLAQIVEATPLKSLVPAQSIAELCLWFLCHNTFVTGQNIIMDGGYSLAGV